MTLAAVWLAYTRSLPVTTGRLIAFTGSFASWMHSSENESPRFFVLRIPLPACQPCLRTSSPACQASNVTIVTSSQMGNSGV